MTLSQWWSIAIIAIATAFLIDLAWWVIASSIRDRYRRGTAGK
jgi:hypothetical protein